MSTILRRTANAAQNASRRRFFATSVAARKDLVQDLYLKEIKGYKAPPAAKDAHVGVVKTYSAPAAPKAPTVPSDIASELAAYDASEPVSTSQPAPQSSGGEETVSGADAYLSFLEQDLPKPEAHHH
ncbi:ATP synthase complex subunit H-domain-containing protein [Lentinula raphanica]|uniref:ATP synthase complex subunit H-domain-containing protein n=1 Tax=Lentinula raphanica TaxID=153919 RepID=A0AA38UIZ4_9AGAR|nr:ATP synthase complex subunit H-domain-containing protein [Lentinula raphanica]KAJ3843030.1 ATP synthase complex subunit H-domain-containing protein [Lentinula raphanica]KAJ3976647.1 ATP synthase complex subunit H-domain-containing protein [Lentinula raphanica]